MQYTVYKTNVYWSCTQFIVYLYPFLWFYVIVTWRWDSWHIYEKYFKLLKGFHFCLFGFTLMFFFYPFHFLISHICTKVHFSNEKTISFHERLHVIIVNGCSVVNANNDRHISAMQDLSRSCRSSWTERSHPSHLSEGALGRSTLLHCRNVCEQCSIWNQSFSVVKTNPSLLLLPLFHKLTYMGGSMQIKNHDEWKKEKG